MPPTQARPLTPNLLVEIYYFLNLASPVDLVFWSVILVGFFSLARISNLVKTKNTDFQLKRAHIKIHRDVMLLTFTRTKTLQFGEKLLEIPLVAIPQSILCPVSAVKRMLSVIPAPQQASAFLLPQKNGNIPYSYSRFQKKLKSVISKTGRNPRLFSSHSMRRGGASAAFQAGVPLNIIQTQGDWAGDSYLRYIALPQADRLSLAESMAQFVQED